MAKGSNNLVSSMKNDQGSEERRLAKEQDRREKLLNAVMCHRIKGNTSVTFTQIAMDLGFDERLTKWRKSWCALILDDGFIAPVEGSPPSMYTADHQLTEKGKNHGPQSNQEHQERIKKRLLNDKAIQIFDWLLMYGSLGRNELALLLQCASGQHNFSYGLKDLRDRRFVDKNDRGKFYLTDKAFLDPTKDRPVPMELDPSLLEERAASYESKKRNNKTKQGKQKSNKRTKS